MLMKKGSVIIQSKPFAYVLSNDHKGRRCDSCLESRSRLLRCTRCTYDWYCNRDCQKSAWNIHKHECQKLKGIMPKIPTDSVRLIARIIYSLKYGGLHAAETICGTIRRFEDLMTHSEHILQNPSKREQILVIYEVLKEFLGQDLLMLPDVMDIFCKMTINSFSICNPEMQSIGVGIYLGPSLLDHSCDPNATVVFNGPVLLVRAVKDIDDFAINKVLISYVDVFATTEERQMELNERYYFFCECNLCHNSDRDKLMKSVKNDTAEFLDRSGSAAVNVNRTLSIIAELKKCNKYSNIMNACEKCLKEIEHFLHPLFLGAVKLWDAAMDACIALGRWNEALEFSLKTVEAYRMYYGPTHPLFGVQLMKIGKLQLFLGHFSDSVNILEEASLVLRLTHGEDHNICADLTSLIMQSRNAF